MTKQKFYEVVDKYLMAMGTDLEDYGLQESTMKEYAMDVACECQKMFEAAYDVEEAYQSDGTLGKMHVPDLEDCELREKLDLLRERREYQQYCIDTAGKMSKSILKKILFSCDGSVLNKANLNRDEKEFLIAYDFYHDQFRKNS